MHTPLRVWWHELNTWEPEDALDFYGRALGWSFEPLQLPDGAAYWTARNAGLPVGGIMALDPDRHEGIPSHWMTYMAVDDIDTAVATTVEAGGSLQRPAVSVPGVGKLAVVADPAGALVGLMQPDHANSRADARTRPWNATWPRAAASAGQANNSDSAAEVSLPPTARTG